MSSDTFAFAALLRPQTSALREMDPFVLNKADPLCAQWFVDRE